jgi:hypothetical protein
MTSGDGRAPYMDGMTWSQEEVRELKKLRLDPVRNTPAKFRLLVAHFLKPGASVFAVTEGEGPVRVSKTLARKVGDLALNGDLDWVVGDGPRKEKSDPLAEPWRTLLWRYPGEFEVQAKEIASGDRATFTRQATRYGPGHRPFVEAIFNRDAGLRDLRRGHRTAVASGDAATARSIGIQITGLLDRWVSG